MKTGSTTQNRPQVFTRTQYLVFFVLCLILSWFTWRVVIGEFGSKVLRGMMERDTYSEEFYVSDYYVRIAKTTEYHGLFSRTATYTLFEVYDDSTYLYPSCNVTEAVLNDGTVVCEGITLDFSDMPFGRTLSAAKWK